MTQLVLSLFPGIGLLDTAFEQEGFTVVRGPDVLWGGDIRRFHPPAGRFEGVIGGPPCQSFSSLARLVRANGHEPRFGNLIPEFERCVAEARPDWFVMENVPSAPEPVVAGYGVRSCLLDNSALHDVNGMGHEQRRVRRFAFGLKGREAPSLARWIDLAVFLLPDCAMPVTASHDSLENTTAWSRRRKETLTGGHDRPPSRRRTVTSNVGGDRVYARRYKLPEACRLQGLSEDFLSDAPFTADAKLKAVANGVPLPMGRAIARAVKEAEGRQA